MSKISHTRPIRRDHTHPLAINPPVSRTEKATAGTLCYNGFINFTPHAPTLLLCFNASSVINRLLFVFIVRETVEIFLIPIG